MALYGRIAHSASAVLLGVIVVAGTAVADEAHKRPVKRNLLFGGLDTSRIQFTKGRDIRLPKAQGDRVNFSIYPYVEVDGRPHPNVEFTFTFKDIE